MKTITEQITEAVPKERVMESIHLKQLMIKNSPKHSQIQVMKDILELSVMEGWPKREFAKLSYLLEKILFIRACIGLKE